MTDFQTSALAREVLESATGQVNSSAIVREVLLSQVTQLWTSVLAREVLVSGGLGGGPMHTAVTVNTS